MEYWFRPKRFWGFWAAYYPATWQGWVVMLVLAAALAAVFRFIDIRSHSASDTLLGVAPFAVIAFLVYDIFCFRTGEYPSWWKCRQKQD